VERGHELVTPSGERERERAGDSETADDAQRELSLQRGPAGVLGVD
jgi:hypothetical protein